MIEAQHELDMARWRRSIGHGDTKDRAELRKIIVGSPVERAAQAIANELDLDFRQILGRRRFKPLANARQILTIALVRAGHSYSETGRLLGVDHSTVIHSVGRAAELERDHGNARALAAAMAQLQRRKAAA